MSTVNIEIINNNHTNIEKTLNEHINIVKISTTKQSPFKIIIMNKNAIIVTMLQNQQTRNKIESDSNLIPIVNNSVWLINNN
jgi:hypothetical protein